MATEDLYEGDGDDCHAIFILGSGLTAGTRASTENSRGMGN